MPIPWFGKRDSSTVEDPVCRMEVDIGKPTGGNWECRRETYYLCGPGYNQA